MNAYVDPDLCIGCTQCAGLCPAVFQMEGTLGRGQPGRSHRRRCRRLWTQQRLPVSAIRIEE